MAVGTLNVAVTASTRKAQEELKAFRAQVRGVGSDVARASKDFGGNTLADFEKKFGGSKPTSVLPPLDDAGLWREQLDNVTASTNKAAAAAEHHGGVLAGLRSSMKELHHIVVGLFIIPKVLSESFEFGKSLGEKLVEGYQKGWAETGKDLDQWIEDSLFPKDAELRNAKIEAMRRGNEERAAKAREEEEKKQQEAQRKELDFQATLTAEKHRRRVLEVGEDMAGFEEDTAKFGRDKALAILDAKERSQGIEDEQLARKEALAKAEADRQRREEQRLKDAKVIADLQLEASEFGMTDAQRQRAALLRGIKDPAMQAQAGGLFDAQQKRIDDKKKRDDEIARLEGERDAIRGRQPAQLLDARSAEGWKALRDSIRQGDPALKKMDEQIAIAKDQFALFQGFTANSEGFDPFG